MPSIEDHLNEQLHNAIKSMTHKCCACKGALGVPDYDSDSEPIVLDDGRVAVAYPSKPCDDCDGTGMHVANLLTPGVANYVMGVVMGELQSAWKHDNYDRLGRVLAWTDDFQTQQLKAAGPEAIKDAIEQFVDGVKTSPLNDVIDAKVTPTDSPANPLSAEELAELGIADE